MRPQAVAVAFALVAAGTLAQAAHAGGGVRLGFGGPLATFVATPAPGGGAARAKAATAKRSAPRKKEIARKPQKHAPRLVKAAPVEAPAKAKGARATADVTPATAPAGAPITGSSALIEQSLSVLPADGVPADAPPADATEAAVAASAPAAGENGGCTRFVPAVGMTVSVGCGD